METLVRLILSTVKRVDSEKKLNCFTRIFQVSNASDTQGKICNYLNYRTELYNNGMEVTYRLRKEGNEENAKMISSFEKASQAFFSLQQISLATRSLQIEWVYKKFGKKRGNTQ